MALHRDCMKRMQVSIFCEGHLCCQYSSKFQLFQNTSYCFAKMQCRIELKLEKSNVTINSVSVSMSSPVTKLKPIHSNFPHSKTSKITSIPSTTKGNLRESRREQQRSLKKSIGNGTESARDINIYNGQVNPKTSLQSS